MAQRHAVPIYAFEEHFPVHVRPASRVSDDDLFELCARNPELAIERTAEGEIIVTSPTGGETGRRNFQLIVQLGMWAARVQARTPGRLDRERLELARRSGAAGSHAGAGDAGVKCGRGPLERGTPPGDVKTTRSLMRPRQAW